MKREDPRPRRPSGRAVPASESGSPMERSEGGAQESLRSGRFLNKEAVSPLERKLLLEAGAGHEAELESVRRETESLRRLLEISRELSSILDMDALLEAILDSAIRLTAAQRGFLLLHEAGQLNVLKGRDDQQDTLDPGASRVSETLARQCLEENRVIPYDNIAGLPELREVRSIKALDLYFVVCVPLRERGAAVGVLYLDSSLPGLRPSSQEISLLEAFASQAAIALTNARLMRDLEESRVLLTRENEDLRAEVRGGARFAAIIGRSQSMMALFDKIRLLKDVEIPVLLLGESGTGKELVARALHYEGLRKDYAFVPVNCAGFPADLLDSLLFGHRRGAFTGAVQDMPGLVEQADGGTLFLDEVGDMPLPLQVKLLRFLESGEFRRVGEAEIRRIRCRVLSATNRDLRALVRERQFREDLYFRLEGVRLEIPPLRERLEDIPLLITHFMELARSSTPRRVGGVTDRARAFLMSYPWPGNVRQLRHAIEAGCALVPDGQPLDESHLRMHLPVEEMIATSGTDRETLQEAASRTEQGCLRSALERNSWNITRAARELGISRQHLHNRIRSHKLKRPGTR